MGRVTTPIESLEVGVVFISVNIVSFIPHSFPFSLLFLNLPICLVSPPIPSLSPSPPFYPLLSLLPLRSIFSSIPSLPLLPPPFPPSLPLPPSALKESCECGPCNPVTICPRPRNVLALVWKNFMRIVRNPGLLLFQFILPTFQICLFCWAIGGDLRGIDVAVVNKDVGIRECMTIGTCIIGLKYNTVYM